MAKTVPAHPDSAPLSPDATTAVLSEADLSLAAQIRSQKLTYLSERKLAALAATCRLLETRAVPGAFIEAGCALGGSSILIASVKATDRPLFVHDVFGMIPPPGEQDTPEVHARYQQIVDGQSKGIMGDRYYGYVADLQTVVRHNFERFGIRLEERSVSLVPGLVQDTLHPAGPVAFAHIDVDWYDPVKTCLERIFPHLSVGGRIVLDDYNAWGGCLKATDEFLRSIPGQYRCDNSAGPMHIEKVRD